MFEAYRIGISLTIKNMVSPQLALLSKEFEKLDLLVGSLTKNLSKIAVDSTGFKALTSATNASAKALDKAALSAEVYERRLQAIHRLGLTGSVMPQMPGGTLPRLPGGGGGSGGSGGGHGGPGYHGGNMHIGPNGVGLGTVGFAMGDLFWPAAAGMATYGAGKALFESAKERDTAVAKIKLLGMTDAQNAEGIGFASNLKIYGTTINERLNAFREAQGVGRETGLDGGSALEFAKLATPILAKLDALGQGLDEESKSALHASNVALLRFDEQSGGLKPGEFSRLANIGYKLRQSSGGTVDFSKLLGVTQMGGAFSQSMTELGWAMAEPILQETGGQAYGTGIASAGRRLTGVMSRNPKNLIEEATRLGLWAPGRQKMTDADAQAFKENFPKFYMDRIIPLYDKFNLSPNDRIRDNEILFSRTGGRIANLIDKQMPSILKSQAAFSHAQNIDQAGETLKKSLTGQELEFQAAWTDFKTQFGTTILPFFTGLLKAGATILRTINGTSPETKKSVAGAGMDIFGALAGNPGGLMHDVSAAGSRFIASLFGSNKQAPIVVNMDGRKVGQITSGHQLKGLYGPQTGPASFDLSSAPMTPGGF